MIKTPSCEVKVFFRLRMSFQFLHQEPFCKQIFRLVKASILLFRRRIWLRPKSQFILKIVFKVSNITLSNQNLNKIFYH